MAEIDYAFVADYAKVEPNGTLTTIGASWTFLQAHALPAVHRLAVAGRVKSHVDEGPVPIKVTITGPDESFGLTAEADLTPTAPRPYGDGLIGLIFAIDTQILLQQTGLYEVMIELVNEGTSRRLAFEVVTEL